MTDAPPPLKAAALRYDPPRDAAPRLVAKGRGEVARRIIETARQHNIPLYRDPDLLELLLPLPLEREIPPDLYLAVAEILAFLYRINQRPAPPPQA